MLVRAVALSMFKTNPAHRIVEVLFFGEMAANVCKVARL